MRQIPRTQTFRVAMVASEQTFYECHVSMKQRRISQNVCLPYMFGQLCFFRLAQLKHFLYFARVFLFYIKVFFSHVLHALLVFLFFKHFILISILHFSLA